MPLTTRDEIIRCTILLFNQYGPMVPMSKISEAAGIAAAMALVEGAEVSRLDGAAVARKMEALGAEFI